MRIILSIILTVFGLAGCAQREPLQSTADLTVVEGAVALPAPFRQDPAVANHPALIGPLDLIEVNVFNIPQLSSEVQVDGSGRISLPLIGVVDAGGKTAAELARDIEDSLSEHHIRDPDVTINMRNSVSQVVTVDGQVVAPGLYPVTNQMTLLRAIASAKGLSEYAREDDVVILRTVEGRRMAAMYNIAAIRRGAYDDPALYADDIVVVGDSPQRRLFRDFVSLSPLLASPLVAILR